MSRGCADACGVAAASFEARDQVFAAIDDSIKLGRCNIRVVVAALSALDDCRFYGCAAHADEDDAYARLQTLVDESDALDAQFEAEQQEKRHAAE